MAVGMHIRELRRQRSLTQTELGGTEYSKSYISAVERDKIVPSYEALRFFATQLGQPRDYLENMLRDSQSSSLTTPTPETQSPADQQEENEIITLLDLILQGKDLHGPALVSQLAHLDFDTNAMLNTPRQARYTFLQGLIAQEQHDFDNARSALEYALALSPIEHHPAILDALGTNYYSQKYFESALIYHQRALHFLQQQESNSDLRLYVELHCSQDYCALGIYDLATRHYTQARHYLRANHNMQLAAELYLGLGYSTYAALYQKQSTSHTHQASGEECERAFQHALSFLVQSRTLYQVSSDFKGEAIARLTQAMVLLDYSSWRLQTALTNAQLQDRDPFINCASLLDEVEEQCRQVLLSLPTDAQIYETLSLPIEKILYTALAYLIRLLTQRAAVARLSGYSSTSIKERTLALYLTQRVINSLREKTLPLSIIHDAVQLSGNDVVYRYQAQSLPVLPDEIFTTRANLSDTMIKAELYLALGEITEELARAGEAAKSVKYYTITENHFQQAIAAMTSAVTVQSTQDPGYLVRIYQRYLYILERRLANTAGNGQTSQTLLNLCQDMLNTLQQSRHPKFDVILPASAPAAQPVADYQGQMV